MTISKIKCLIIDDEVASQKVIEHFIAETEVLQHIASFTSTQQAYKYLQLNNDVDLIFLDINMPEQDGLSFYKNLDSSPPAIFTTAYPQYALEGFEVNAIDYLLKPIAYQRFLKAIKKVLDQQNRSKRSSDFIAIKENKTVHKIALDSIIYAEATGDYVKVISENLTMLTHSTFSKFIEHLPPQFLRVHKSFCVNTDKVTKLSGNQIHLSSYNLPIGQTYKASVLDALNV